MEYKKGGRPRTRPANRTSERLSVHLRDRLPGECRGEECLEDRRGVVDEHTCEAGIGNPAPIALLHPPLELGDFRILRRLRAGLFDFLDIGVQTPRTGCRCTLDPLEQCLIIRRMSSFVLGFRGEGIPVMDGGFGGSFHGLGIHQLLPRV